MTGIARVALVILLTASGLLKLLSPSGSASWMPAWSYYGVAVLELVLAAGVAVRRDSLCPVATIVLFAAGGLAALLLGEGTSCGCLGSWIRITRAEHLILAGLGGLLGTIVLARPSRRRPASHA